MTAAKVGPSQEVGPSHIDASPPVLRRRLVVAVAGGLIAMMVALGALVVDLSTSRAELQSQLDDNRRTINALTKQLYWAQEQLGQVP